MKVKLERYFKDFNGDPITKTQEDKSPIELKDIIITALTATLESDKNQTGKEKFEFYQLCQKVNGKKEVDLETNDISKIKERIGSCYGTLIVGQAWDFLEGK